MSDLPDIEILTADGRTWLRCDDSNEYYARLRVGTRGFRVYFDPKLKTIAINNSAADDVGAVP